MSDDRKEAEQDLATAMEDTLGSSLTSSFAPPRSEPQASNLSSVTQRAEETAPTISEDHEGSTVSIPGMEEWKDTYDSYMEKWQAESAIARERAEKTRKRIEDEHAAKAKAKKEEEAAIKKTEAAKIAEQKKKEKLKQELEDVKVSKRKGQAGSEEREQKVKEAWEMIKDGGVTENREVVTDARGTTDADVAAGQVHVEGEKKEPLKQPSYDPTTSKDPLPPTARFSSPPSPSTEPSSSQTASRHSNTSQAWEEISISPSSAEDLSPPVSASSSDAAPPKSVKFASSAATNSSSVHPASKPTSAKSPSTTKDFPSHLSHPAAYTSSASTSAAAASQSDSSATKPTAPSQSSQPQALQPQTQQANSSPRQHNTPPAQPPSLTLALFSSPDSLSISKVLAVVGINVVLPFINGIMLGFGEIFAREAFQTTRQYWRQGRGIFSWRGTNGNSRGVGGVGLSGSGGF